MYDCLVCNAKEQFSEIGSYETCRVCGWEDDDYQIDFPDDTGANKYTLNQARRMWANGETIKPYCPNPKQSRNVRQKEALAVY